MRGTCKWFDSRKGYGFIAGDDGRDVFVHASQIIADADWKTLNAGDTVEYDVAPGVKGSQAVNVRVVSPATNAPQQGSVRGEGRSRLFRGER